MSGIGVLAPMAAWLGLLVGPLVLFYFLKLKRPNLTVPSLVLWRQVLQDQRVNSPFQRFKRNLLLLLQLLLLLLLVGAALQPYFRGAADAARRTLVLIDCSASMAALDPQTQQSRLDVAQQRVRELIDNLHRDQELCIVRFAATASRLSDFTNNRRLLLEALEQVRVQDVPGRLDEALGIAEALSRQHAFERVVLYSDGNFSFNPDFALPFTLDFQRLEQPGVNVGITALGAQRVPGDKWELFVRLTVNHDSEAGTLRLKQDGQEIHVQDMVVRAEQPQRVALTIPGQTAASLELLWQPDGFDALASDNTAFLELQPTRPLSIYVAPTRPAERQALAGLDDAQISGGDTPGVSSVDLLVTDRQPHLATSAQVTLTQGFVPEALANLLTLHTNDPDQIIDWRRDHPLLQHVLLTDVLLQDQARYAENASEADLENLGYEVLIHGSKGPLLLQHRVGQRYAYHLLFDPMRSTLPYRIGFPVLLANAARQARQLAGLLETAGPRTGVLPTLPGVSERQYLVRGPDGKDQSVQANVQGQIPGALAQRVGRYEILDGGKLVQAVSVSLLDEAESRLAGWEELRFKELAVTAQSKAISSDRSFWRALALLALVLLVLEWWYFNRPRGLWGRKGAFA